MKTIRILKRKKYKKPDAFKPFETKITLVYNRHLEIDIDIWAHSSNKTNYMIKEINSKKNIHNKEIAFLNIYLKNAYYLLKQ